jgi:hypothetical protein
MYPTPVLLSASLHLLSGRLLKYFLPVEENILITLVLPVRYSATHPGFLKSSVSQIRPAQAGMCTNH